MKIELCNSRFPYSELPSPIKKTVPLKTIPEPETFSELAEPNLSQDTRIPQPHPQLQTLRLQPPPNPTPSTPSQQPKSLKPIPSKQPSLYQTKPNQTKPPTPTPFSPTPPPQAASQIPREAYFKVGRGVLLILSGESWHYCRRRIFRPALIRHRV